MCTFMGIVLQVIFCELRHHMKGYYLWLSCDDIFKAAFTKVWCIDEYLCFQGFLVLSGKLQDKS